MALADAEQVEKEELLDALSKKEGELEVSPEDFTEAEEDGKVQPPEELDPKLVEFLEAESDQEFPERENAEASRSSASRERRRIGGIISTYRQNPELNVALGHQRINKNVERLQHEHAAKVTSASEAKVQLANAEQLLKKLQAQAAAGELKNLAKLSHQEVEVRRSWEKLSALEAQRDAAELALLKAEQGGGASTQHALQDHRTAKATARELHADEVRRAKHAIRKDNIAQKEEEVLLEAIQAEQTRREDEARYHQLQGRRRLLETQDRQRARKEQMEEVREARFDHDVKRVMQLKESRDAILLKIKSQNERRDKKQQKVKVEREKEKQSLLRDGKNPYEVWRKEEMEAKKEEERLRLTAQAELRSEKLMEQMIIEDKSYKRSVKEAKKKLQQKEEFQREVGNYAKEKKISQFIRQMTIGSVDVLDPTGTALRIDPSKVSIQRTNAFGLGHARKEEIQKVEKQVRAGQKRIEQWKEENQITEQEEEEEMLRMEQEQMDNFLRSASGEEGDPFEEEEVEEDEEEEEDDEEEDYERKFWVPNYSKLEQQYMAAARERQRQNICSVQTWQGKEFKGDAFLAKPAVIAFNDFEVGRRYRQVIEVTNVSLTFNQFKLLPLEDSVKDFFEINFVPPGRMSAGVTRYITLWFVPKVSQDIVSTFPILAKTGRIDFPLRCTTKKTILTITPQDASARPVVDFGTVLFGESGERELAVKNTGALAASFVLSRLDPPSETPEAAAAAADADAAADAADADAADAADAADLADAADVADAAPEGAETGGDGAAEAGPEAAAEAEAAPEADGADTAADATMKPEAEPVGDISEMMSFPERGSCKGFGSQKISFSFKPTRLGTFQAELLLRFFNGAPGDASYEQSVRVMARGSCLDVPIFADSPEYRLETCVSGHIFRESVNVRNRASVAMKIQVQKPRQIEGELQLNTALAYIQGHGSQSIQVKFSPKADFLERNPHFSDPEGGVGAFKIPMRIVGADQVLPVDTCLTGVLTTDAMSFSPQVLNFGCCYVGSSSALRLVFVNESVLTRRFAFTRLPSYLSIQEVPVDVLEEEAWGGADCPPGSIAVLDGGDGTFGAMLPGERRQVSVIFSPESATEMNHKISFKVLTGELCAREFTIPCTGQGVSQIIELSQRQLDLASVPKDSTSRESLIVKNVSKVPQTINVVMPEYGLSALKATPVCCTLAPRESKRLQIEFKPAEEYMNLLKMPPEDPPEVPEGAEPPEPEMDEEEYKRHQLTDIRLHGGRRWEAQEGTVHSSWRLPIYFRPANVREGGRYQNIFLGVRTCVLPSILSPSPAKLDFGDITAGQRHVLPLVITNLVPEEPQELQVEALPENQCFAVLNAPRSVGERAFQFMIEFQPRLVQIYQTCLSLKTSKTRVQVPLRGKGVCPVLKIEPEDGVIHMGSVVYNKEAKDYTTNQLVIKNESPFELVYKLETVIRGDRGPPPFILSPQSATVAANSSLNVTVTFQPRRPNVIFREKVLVNVPNQREPTYVYLYGHCFNYQAYCLPGMNFTAFGRQEAEAKAAFLDTLAVGTGSTVNAEGGFEYPSAQSKEFSLVFERGENLKLLMVGASVAPGTPTAPQEKGLPAVTYDFQILPGEFSNLFSVEVPEGAGKPDKQAKGNLQMGKPALKVAFRYNPPAENLPVFGGVSLDLLGGIGQWISVKAKGVLAGGFVPPGSTPNQELAIELKAYLQQI